jgi:hypothetical protein
LAIAAAWRMFKAVAGVVPDALRGHIEDNYIHVLFWDGQAPWNPETRPARSVLAEVVWCFMQIHIFQSLKERDVFGFTADGTGGNLPSDLGPWTRSGNAIETGLGRLASGAVGSSELVFTAIEKDGFYVARSETISRSTGIPWVGK